MIAYVVAVLAMAIAATSALTLINAVEHFDPPEDRSLPEPIHSKAA